jgi:hypothetical protein
MSRLVGHRLLLRASFSTACACWCTASMHCSRVGKLRTGSQGDEAPIIQRVQVPSAEGDVARARRQRRASRTRVQPEANDHHSPRSVPVRASAATRIVKNRKGVPRCWSAFVVVASLPRRAHHCRRPGGYVAIVNTAWSTPSPGASGDGSREASHVAVPAVTVVVHRQRLPSSQARRSGPRGMSRPDAAPTTPSSR